MNHASSLRTCLLLLLGAGLTCGAHAQPEQQPLPLFGPIRFYHQRAEHLSQTRTIVQDHEGFMWFGQLEWSGGDLYRYDGHTYTHFDHDPYDSTSLSDGSVLALYEDREHTLWVGKSSGLNRFDRRAETFQRYEHDADDPTSISPGPVWDILEDRQGTFWVATGGGLSRMDREVGTFTRYLPDPENTRIRALLEDQDGTLWVGSWGLCRFDPQAGAFTRYLPFPRIAEPLPDDPGASVNWVRAIHEDPQGRLWVGTWTGGLYVFDRETETFTNYRHDPSGSLPFPDDNIAAILDDPAGGLWLATNREGLVWIDPETAAMTAYRHDQLDPYSLSGDRVNALYRDRQGVFWVGTWRRDVDRFDRAARPFMYYASRPGGNGGLFYPHVNTMAEGPDGVLWVINGNMLVHGEEVLTRIDRAAGTFRHFRHSPNDPASLDAGPYRVFVDAAGTVWIGGRVDVLSRMDAERPGRFTHFRPNPDDDRSLPPGSISSMYEDPQGQLWVGNDGFGLSRLDDHERGLFTRFPLGDGVGDINTIFEDTKGKLWVGTLYGGLFRFDPETGHYENYRRDPGDPNSLAGNMVHGIWERPQDPGVLWLSVFPHGLGRFDPERGTFRLYTTDDGLPDNNAQGVLGDEQGRLWISTDHGLSCFDPDAETFTNYDVDDGLQGVSFYAWAHHKGPSGQLYFGGPKGLNAFYPDQVRDNPHPPQVALTTLRLGQEVVTPRPDGPLRDRLAETTKLTLSHWQNDVALEYVGLHFRHPEKNHYQYMLEGYDERWSDETLVRQATYTNLPPGDYTFRVRASNSDGVWNEDGASVAITILPPWWRTTWAYVLYGLLLAAAAALGERLYRRRIVRRERAAALLREKDLRTEAAEAYANFLQAENERQTQELEAARRLQLSMLPEAMPDHPTVDLVAFMQTATEVGGDYYDFDLAADGTLTLAIGDATGHGTKAGTMVTAAKSLWHAFSGEEDLVQVLEKSTRALRRMHLPKLYMALAVVRLRDYTLELAGAGMPPALIYRKATQQVETVPLKGVPLGGPMAIPYQKTSRSLSPGDTVVLMSDGFPELFSDAGEMLGYERAVTVFAGVGGHSPEEIIAHLKETGEAWSNGRAQDDDVTFVVMKMKARSDGIQPGRHLASR